MQRRQGLAKTLIVVNKLQAGEIITSIQLDGASAFWTVANLLYSFQKCSTVKEVNTGISLKIPN